MKINRNTSQNLLSNEHGYQQRLVYPLGLMMLVCIGVLIILPHDITTAQTLSPTPSASATAIPPSATLSPTPSNTSTPDATLSGLMQRRVTIYAGNAANLQAFYRWQGHIAEVSSLVFTSANALFSTSLNSINGFPFVRMWQIQDANINPIKGIFENSSGTITRISRSRDGRLLMVGFSGEAQIWDAATGRAMARIPQTWASTVADIMNNSSFIVSGENHVVGIWAVYMPYDYLETGVIPEGFVVGTYSSQLITAFQMNAPVVQVDYDIAVNRHFILTKDGVLHLYFTQDYVQSTLTTVPQDAQSSPTEDISSTGVLMAIQSNQSRVIYAGSHRDVIAYDYRKNQIVARYALEKGVSCLAIHPRSHLLLIGDRSGVLNILHLDDFKLIKQINIGGVISACAINDNSTLIATGNDDGHLALWGVD